MEDNINKILGIEPETPQKDFKPPVPRKKKKEDMDVDTDHTYSRENYYNLIEKGQEAIEGILQVAREGEHPRAYEVAGQLIKNVGDTVDKLQDLNKKLKELKELPKIASPSIKNALFVGSTAELQKLLKKEALNDEGPERKVITPEENDIQDK